MVVVGQAGRLSVRVRDVHVARVRGFGVAGEVGRPPGDGVLAGPRDGERAGVGLRRAAVDRVPGADDARARPIVGRQGHALVGRLPARMVVGLQAGRRGHGRRGVEVDVAGAGRLGVADVVDRPVLDGVPAVGRDHERVRVGQLGAGVDRVVDVGDAREAVVGRQGHGLGDVHPGGLVGGQAGRAAERRAEIDVHVAGHRRLDVADVVDRPVPDPVPAFAGDRERRARRSGARRRRRCSRCVATPDPAPSSGVMVDGLVGAAPAAVVVGLQAARRRHRRGGVDAHRARAGRAFVAGVVEGLVLEDVHAVVGAVAGRRHVERIPAGRLPGGVALHAVAGRRDAAAAGVGGGELDGHGAVLPAGGSVIAHRRQRRVDVDVAGMGRLGVAGRVDRPPGDLVRRLAAHGERSRVGLRGSAVDRVVRDGDAGPGAVVRHQGDLPGGVHPAGVAVRLEGVGAGGRGRRVDPHRAGAGRTGCRRCRRHGTRRRGPRRWCRRRGRARRRCCPPSPARSTSPVPGSRWRPRRCRRCPRASASRSRPCDARGRRSRR